MALPPSPAFATPERLFYDRHIGYVRRRFRRMGITDEDLHELTQQTFAIALTSGQPLPGSFPRERAWLCEIVFRVAMNFLRLHRHCREESGWDVDSFEACAQDPETAFEARELLGAALRDSTEEERSLLWERFVEASTLSEMSDSLGITRASVWSRLGRLRRRFETRAHHFAQGEPSTNQEEASGYSSHSNSETPDDS